MFAHGALSKSLTIVTAYDSLGADALAFVLKQSQIHTILIQQSQFPRLAEVIVKGKETYDLKHVLYIPASPKELKIPTIPSDIFLKKGIEVHNFDEFVLKDFAVKASASSSSTASVNVSSVKPATLEDIACIMYTSGTTGNPKGVRLTHGNLLAAVGAASAMVNEFFEVPTEVIIGYLPLAHVLEFVVELTCIHLGIPIGYGTIRTLSDVDMLPGCDGDIKELKPTVMAG